MAAQRLSCAARDISSGKMLVAHESDQSSGGHYLRTLVTRRLHPHVRQRCATHSTISTLARCRVERSKRLSRAPAIKRWCGASARRKATCATEGDPCSRGDA